MADQAIVFHNCRVLRNGRFIRDEVWVRGKKIVTPQEGRELPHKRVDCRNQIVAPGFIDIQINGAYGVDFSTTEDMDGALRTCSKLLPQDGVTSYLPTIITSSPKEYEHRVKKVCFKEGGREVGASVLGTHLEGPFISMEKRGCHPPELVREFPECKDGVEAWATLESVYGKNFDQNVVMLTLAPEQPGARAAIEVLASRGVVVSLGHSSSDFETGRKGLAVGATALTHLFSAMNGFGHHEPSLPGLICADVAVGTHRKKLADTIRVARGGAKGTGPAEYEINKRRVSNAGSEGGEESVNSAQSSEYCPSQLYYGLIADCVHTHPYSLRLAYKLNRHGLCLITDAMAALGLPDGEYKLGETEVVVGDTPRRALMKGTNTLAGVVASLNQCIRLFVAETGCGLPFGLTAASLHPARAIGIEGIKGHLEPGADADIVIIDDDVNVIQTWVAGQLCYDSSNPEEHRSGITIHMSDNAWVHSWADPQARSPSRPPTAAALA